MQALSLEHENRILRNLLQSPRQKAQRKVRVAELIGINPAPLEQQIIIDKGQNHGVYLNQPVLDTSGIIGQVSMVTPFSATVTLISNPGHALLGRINRSGIRVLVTGTGNSERLELHHVPAGADVRKDDRIIASGLGGRFPQGYPVATVTHVEKEAGDIFATIYAKPAANLGYSHQMLLVWPDGDGGVASDAGKLEK